MYQFLIAAVFLTLICGCSSKPSDDRPATTPSGPAAQSGGRETAAQVAAEIRDQIPRETSIENAQWKAAAESAAGPRLEDFENQALSAVVLFTPGMPPEAGGSTHKLDPADIISHVMRSESKGYGTLFQPDSITECNCTVDGDTAAGAFQYEAIGIRGRIDFTALRSDGKWRLAEFSDPQRRIVTRRGSDGKWKTAADGAARFLDRPEFYVACSTRSGAPSESEIRLNGTVATTADLAEKTLTLWREFVAAKENSSAAGLPGDDASPLPPLLAFCASPNMPSAPLFTVVRAASPAGAMRLRLSGEVRRADDPFDETPLEILVKPAKEMDGPTDVLTEMLEIRVRSDNDGRLSGIAISGDTPVAAERAVDYLRQLIAGRCSAAEQAGVSAPDVTIYVDDRLCFGDLRTVVSVCTRHRAVDGKTKALCQVSLISETSGPVFQNTPPALVKMAPQVGLVPPMAEANPVIDVGQVNVFTQSGGSFAAAAPDAGGLTLPYGDSMDRITQEILIMLAKQKTLVVWVVDQSQSMEGDRKEIYARIERVYTELGLSAAAKDDALLSGVAGYGATYAVFTPKPTSDSREVLTALKNMPVDPTGIESQCTAVMASVSTFAKLAEAPGSPRRQLAFIVITDESGDPKSNEGQLENAIQSAQAAKAKIFFLGRETVFGGRQAHLRYQDAETKTEHLVAIDRGPETPAPEMLQTDGLARRNDDFPSGFGPYEQSRMARQTGGLFLMLSAPETALVGRRTDLRYDAYSMRDFLPDLSMRRDYVLERDHSPFRKAIARVINDLDPVGGPNGNLDPSLSNAEVRVGGFPLDRAQFAGDAERNIQKGAELLKLFESAERALESVRPMRDREKSPRWRANYDLIYAQVVAYQVRLQEYVWYLAEFSKSPKDVKNALGEGRPTTSWKLQTVARQLKPTETKGARDRAEELFRKLIKEYAGTPWAARAQEELKRGYGLELVEDYEDPRAAGVKVPKL